MRGVIPINVDRNAAFADYRMIAGGPGRLLVTSIFFTFQGEGPFAGRPAVFLRLAGCNLGKKDDCAFCDTYFELAAAKVYTVHGLADALMSHWPEHLHHVKPLFVVTGGEPLMQTVEVLHLMTHLTSVLRGHGCPEERLPTWQFETNGLYLTDALLYDARISHILDHPPLVPDVHFVVSPKASRSLGTYPHMKHLPVWSMHPNVYLKFVVDDDPDSMYHDVPGVVTAVMDPRRVYVSGATVYREAGAMPGKSVSVFDPQVIDQTQTARNYMHAANVALGYGFNACFQTHLFAGVQ